MTKEITVTKHAAKRIVERVGGNRKSVSRIAKRAYDNGYTAEDTRGNLRYWIESKYYSHDGIGNEMRLYSDKLYVFDSGILVTVLTVPQDLYNSYDKLIRPVTDQGLHAAGME